MTSQPPPSYQDLFGGPPAVRAAAPGRVNLIGEHTDYNGGFVLPAAIPQQTVVELGPRADGRVAAWSGSIGPAGELQEYALGSEAPGGTWVDYLQGITHALGAEGHRLRGCSLRITSTIPLGSGLSSSAALEISILRALREAFGLALEEVELALIGQRVENGFVGAPVGIMDQMACALATETQALFLDTRSLAFERIPLPGSAELLVIDSGVAHNHAAGAYRARRAECERAARLLGVGLLRDVGEEDLPTVARLPPPLSRRARHVVTENARVLGAVAALRAGDLPAAGALFADSHASMRDDFEVSIPEIDLLVSLAGRHDNVFGARLTGGGFGGSIVALARRGSGRRVADTIAKEYFQRTRMTARVLIPLT